MKLVDIPELEVALKNERTSKVKILHKYLFNTEGDRSNRKRIRDFSGFNFDIDSAEFKTKLADTQTTFSLNDLITICNLLCISNEGSTIDISTRLITYLCDLNLLQNNILQNESDAESETEFNPTNTENLLENNTQIQNSSNITEFSSPSQPQRIPVQHFMPSTVNFHDIESLISPFDGSSFINIDKWINDFEDVTNMFNLSDMHKFVFLKRSLRGKAQLLVNSECHINSWNKLKQLLLSEFGLSYNSADLHDMLNKRKLKENESLDEYYLIMKQLCARGNIEDSALMQYIINGIPDPVYKKSILYGCVTISEFKQKLKIYDKIRTDAQNTKPHKFKHEVLVKEKSFRPKTDIRCYNCGNNGHKSINCNNKDKGPRCFNCSQFGHKSADCKQPRKPNSKINSTNVATVTSKTFMTKQVSISALDVMSLIDTGSEKTLLKESIFRKLPTVSNLEPAAVTLTGFGNTTIQPFGFFSTDIVIDNSMYNTNVYVIPDYSIYFDCIIGTDIIQQSVLTINGNDVSMTKIVKNDDMSENFLINVTNVEDEFNPDLSHILDENIHSKILQVIQNYSPQKTKSTDVKLSIHLKDETPISSRPRRLAPSEKVFVEKQISEWLDKGIIQKSTSDFSSPIVLVKKKDDSFRLCIDYRKLNAKTFKQRFPLPIIDDIIDQLHSANVFTTLDLKNAFFHVEIDENSRKYTSFVTHSGQFEFLFMSFGLSDSPLVFQRYIYNVFRDLIHERILLIYLDDIIIPADNEAEGLQKLQRVLHTASEYGLELNIKKCRFLQHEIDFLGYHIKKGQLNPSPLKTKAVVNFPEPKCIKDVQSFVGLTSYFRKFVPDFSLVAKPLTDLLKKNTKFCFDDEQRHAFNKLKYMLSSDPVLCIYNPHSETELHCDASIDGYGAVLLQKSIADNQLHPVYFMSKKTTETERKYSSYELEVLAVIEALKKFRVYLLGIPFKIVTDCNAFALTMNKKDLSTKIARWALMLSDYNYTIEHRQGSRMRHVDALSRNPTCMFIHDSFTSKIMQSQDTDKHIQAIKEILKTKPYDSYVIKNNILYKCHKGLDLIVVPDEMHLSIIKHAHDKGHFGRKRCEEIVNEQFFIPNVSSKIDKVISNCITCLLYNRKRGKQEGELHPLPKGETPLQTYHIDHLGPLETTNKNYKHILCLIDAFTKFVWLYPCKTTSASEVISKLQQQSFIFGNPSTIISDKGSAFTSNEFHTYCQEENIKHATITTGLPRANGQVERLNSTVISVISKMSNDEPNKWFKHVPKVQQVINSTYQRSIKNTPFELLFGTKMKQKEDLQIIDLLNSAIEEQFMKERENLRKEAKENILKIQQENRQQYNLRRRKPRSYNLNDLVVIKRTQQGPGLKLKPKFFGPYKVTKVKFNDTYDVEKFAYTEGPMNTTTCAEYMKPWPDEV